MIRRKIFRLRFLLAGSWIELVVISSLVIVGTASLDSPLLVKTSISAVFGVWGVAIGSNFTSIRLLSGEITPKFESLNVVAVVSRMAWWPLEQLLLASWEAVGSWLVRPERHLQQVNSEKMYDDICAENWVEFESSVTNDCRSNLAKRSFSSLWRESRPGSF